MSFLTDVTATDIIVLECDQTTVKLRITKRTGNKVRLSIDAGEEVRITKKDGKKKNQID